MENVPADLRRVLAATPKAGVVWSGLTSVARRDFVSWIESAKQDATRKRRVESVPSRLAAGKRRPCCYALVPMSLYKALATNVKATKVWKSLTPLERRDFADWVSAAANAVVRERRIEKVRALLAAGKRHL